MIASLTGILKSKSPTEVVVDVQGVGYALLIPLSTFDHLPEIGSTITLMTHLQVREDALQLYGFGSDQERFFFRQLISVNGIGPKIAQSILSGISVGDLREQIIHGNVGALMAIPGIGRKTAERLVLELREKIAKLDPISKPFGNEAEEIRSQALLALTSLGYSRPVAEKAIHKVIAESNGAALAIEELIKRALRHAAAP